MCVYVGYASWIPCSAEKNSSSLTPFFFCSSSSSYSSFSTPSCSSPLCLISFFPLLDSSPSLFHALAFIKLLHPLFLFFTPPPLASPIHFVSPTSLFSSFLFSLLLSWWMVLGGSIFFVTSEISQWPSGVFGKECVCVSWEHFTACVFVFFFSGVFSLTQREWVWYNWVSLLWVGSTHTQPYDGIACSLRLTLQLPIVLSLSLCQVREAASGGTSMTSFFAWHRT